MIILNSNWDWKDFWRPNCTGTAPELHWHRKLNFKCQNCSQIALRLHWNRIETAKFRMIKLIVIISFLMIFINRESIIFRFALKPHWNGHIPLIISVEISQLLQTVSLWLRTAMKLLWNCSKTALKLLKLRIMELHWYCTDIALKLRWNSTEIALQFCWIFP